MIRRSNPPIGPVSGTDGRVSTQSPPLPPLRVLLRQTAPDRSVMPHLPRDPFDHVLRFCLAEGERIEPLPDALVGGQLVGLV